MFFRMCCLTNIRPVFFCLHRPVRPFPVLLSPYRSATNHLELKWGVVFAVLWLSRNQETVFFSRICCLTNDSCLFFFVPPPRVHPCPSPSKSLRRLVLSSSVDWTTRLWRLGKGNTPIQSMSHGTYDYVCDAKW